MAPVELRREPVAVKNFFDSVGSAAETQGGRRTVTADVARAVVADGSVKMPGSVDALLARYPEAAHGAILDSVLQGVDRYQAEHGFAPDAAFIETALHNAVKTVTPLADLQLGVRLDSASNSHHDQLSLQPATAIVSIMAQFAEAIPFAQYLPADVKNNEARLAIMTNQANSDFGDYLAGASLDGIAGGGAYLDSERVCVLSVNGGGGTALTYTVTQKASDAVGGIAPAAGNVALPLLRGRTVILVNGLPAAREAEVTAGSGNNTIAGQAVVNGSSYAISGTVNSDTGAISITSSPALPAGTVVEALAYVDFERAPQHAPKIGTEVQIYKLFARASRGIVQVSVDALTQMQQELSLDPRGQALLSLRAQFAQERHYRALKKMLRIGAGNAATWDYDWAGQKAEKSRDQVWLNLAPVLAALSQQMANDTVDHGITTLYMTGELAAQVKGLPSTIWEGSGITDRPGVYRLGRLFGRYDVYYTPKLLTEAGGGASSQILCVGRATNTARNPIVLGDAVPPLMLPLAMGTDLVQGDGFYTRGFTEINPHTPSAKGAALISVTNIK